MVMRMTRDIDELDTQAYPCIPCMGFKMKEMKREMLDNTTVSMNGR